MPSFKVEVLVEGQWVANKLRFGSKTEAQTYSDDLASRWTLIQDSRVAETDDPVNYENGYLKS